MARQQDRILKTVTILIPHVYTCFSKFSQFADCLGMNISVYYTHAVCRQHQPPWFSYASHFMDFPLEFRAGVTPSFPYFVRPLQAAPNSQISTSSMKLIGSGHVSGMRHSKTTMFRWFLTDVPEPWSTTKQWNRCPSACTTCCCMICRPSNVSKKRAAGLFFSWLLTITSFYTIATMWFWVLELTWITMVGCSKKLLLHFVIFCHCEFPTKFTHTWWSWLIPCSCFSIE